LEIVSPREAPKIKIKPHLYFVKPRPPKSPPMEVSCEIQFMSMRRRGIYNIKFTGGWLKTQPVETYFHWWFS
jgi:hypothetical protein